LLAVPRNQDSVSKTGQHPGSFTLPSNSTAPLEAVRANGTCRYCAARHWVECLPCAAQYAWARPGVGRAPGSSARPSAKRRGFAAKHGIRLRATVLTWEYIRKMRAKKHSAARGRVPGAVSAGAGRRALGRRRARRAGSGTEGASAGAVSCQGGRRGLLARRAQAAPCWRRGLLARRAPGVYCWAPWRASATASRN
jgi:hypothetical protein